MMRPVLSSASGLAGPGETPSGKITQEITPGGIAGPAAD